MKEPIKFVVGALLLIFAIAAFVFLKPGSPTNFVGESGFGYEALTDSQQGVDVEILPLNLSRNSERWEFKITFNTHSVELSEDIVGVLVMLDDSGAAQLPVAWEGDGPGGHHREGIVIFKNSNRESSFVELRMRGVGGAELRVFRWDLLP